MKKGAVFAAVLSVGIVALLIYQHVEKSTQTSSVEAAPVEVAVQTVTHESVDVTLDLPGRTQAYRIAEIRPQVSGIVVKRLFDEGSDIKKGQQLYQIDPILYQASYDSAVADLQKAEANMKALQAKQSRYEELIKIGGISKQDYDDALAAFDGSKAQILSAKAAVTTAKANLDYTKVYSPISGRIGKSSVTEGALVTANQADALAVVQQLDKIYVDVTQSVSELRKIRRMFDEPNKAPQVSLTVEGESEPYQGNGVLQFADVTVDQGTGTVGLRVLFDNPKLDLLPGMFVRAHISQQQNNKTLLVPQKAVIRNPDNSTTIWLVEGENKVKTQPVSLGPTMGSAWVVLSGLNEGDKIVVEGGQKISAETVIKPIEETTKEK